MSKKPEPRTLDQFLTELADNDLTIKEWARQKGLSFNAVYMVVHGRSSGIRGEARKVVRAMGLPVPQAAGVGRASRKAVAA